MGLVLGNLYSEALKIVIFVHCFVFIIILIRLLVLTKAEL